MKKEYRTLGEKQIKGVIVSIETLRESLPEGEWKRVFENPEELMSKFGLTNPPETIWCAGSRSDTPSVTHNIAGLSRVRYDKNDNKKINIDQIDFKKVGNEIIMITKPNKKIEHHFDSIQEWLDSLEESPLHNQ